MDANTIRDTREAEFALIREEMETTVVSLTEREQEELKEAVEAGPSSNPVRNTDTAGGTDAKGE